CQSLIGPRNRQQLTLGIRAGHLLGLSTCLFGTHSPMLCVTKRGRHGSPASCLRWTINEAMRTLVPSGLGEMRVGELSWNRARLSPSSKRVYAKLYLCGDGCRGVV